MAAQSNRPFVDALLALTGFFVGDGKVDDSLTRIATVCVESTPAVAAGLTLHDGTSLATSVFTDPTSPHLDAAQYETGDGPCIDAVRYGQVYRLDDTRSPTRWRAFAAACAERGILSTISFPLVGRNGTIGALNLYAPTPAAFTADDEETGRAFAAAAAMVLANTEAYWEAQDLSENLKKAMESRAVIEQAKGMLMARSPGLTPDAAFELLRTASQRENVKLRDIAARIVEHRSVDDPT